MSYIGQTMRPFNRRYQSKWWKSVKNPYLLNAIKKYGHENFTIDLLHKDVKSLDELNALEISEILKHGSLYPNGYNLCEGGARHSTINPETKKQQYKKISLKLKGRIRSESERLAISNGKKGTKLSNEHKLKLSLSKKGKPSYKKGISTPAFNKKQWVTIVCSNNLIFTTIKEFEKYFKVTNISAILNKTRNSNKFLFIKVNNNKYLCEVL